MNVSAGLAIAKRGRFPPKPVAMVTRRHHHFLGSACVLSTSRSAEELNMFVLVDLPN